MEQKMPEHHLSQMSLIDVVEQNKVTQRLYNSIQRAISSKLLSFNTVGEYIKLGNQAFFAIKQLPNIGFKTAKEFDGLIKELVSSECFNAVIGDKNKPFVLPSEVLELTLKEFVDMSATSERLKNSIALATKEGVMPLNTVGDYINEGNNSTRLMMKLLNFGKNTAIELDDLIKGGSLYTSNEKEKKILVDPQQTEISNIFEALLVEFHKNLSDRDYSILKLRAIGNQTLEEIGQNYNVTRERVRQIESKVKSKLVKMFENAFVLISNKIDTLLDDSFGEVGLKEAANIFELTQDTLRLLVYICSSQCKKPIIVKNELLMRSSNVDNYTQWNVAIDDALNILSWPLNVADIINEVPDIPFSYLERFLIKKRGAVIDRTEILELNKISQMQRVIYVLRDAGKPIHFTEIARKYRVMFGEDIRDHNAHAIAGRLEDALIVDRGMYSLYETFNVSQNKVDDIRRIAFEYLKGEKKYISSKVIYSELFEKKVEYPEIVNSYIVHGILQDDSRFVFKRGLMIGVKEDVELLEFKPFSEEVLQLVTEKGPISISEIKKAVSATRNVLSVGISKALDDSVFVVKVKSGLWDTIDKTFGKPSLYTSFQLAIRILLSEKDRSLFEITENIRKLKLFDFLDVTKSLVLSTIDMMNDVEKKDQVFSVKTKSKKIEIYVWLKQSSMQHGSTKLELKEKLIKRFGEDLATTYISADATMQSSVSGKPEDDLLSSNNELNSILSAFGI